MLYKDQYGRFEIEAEHEFDGKFYQWRKYQNSPVIKKMGGVYANYCEDERIKFYKSSYIREKAFSKFIDEGAF